MFEEFLKNTNVHDDSSPTLPIILSYANYRYMINYYFKPVFRHILVPTMFKFK